MLDQQQALCWQETYYSVIAVRCRVVLTRSGGGFVVIEIQCTTERIERSSCKHTLRLVVQGPFNESTILTVNSMHSGCPSFHHWGHSKGATRSGWYSLVHARGRWCECQAIKALRHIFKHVFSESGSNDSHLPARLVKKVPSLVKKKKEINKIISQGACHASSLDFQLAISHTWKMLMVEDFASVESKSCRNWFPLISLTNKRKMGQEKEGHNNKVRWYRKGDNMVHTERLQACRITRQIVYIFVYSDYIFFEQAHTLSW